MNTWRVKMNAQAELRVNLRTAIKESPFSQTAAAKEAGIKHCHLTGFLSCNNWLTREALDKLAAVLDIPTDELLGASIFKDQRDRWPEFDFEPPRWKTDREARELSTGKSRFEGLLVEAKAAAIGSANTAPEVPEDRTRAICCECGALRLISTRGLHGWDESKLDAPRHRAIRMYACIACATQTRHAILRVDEKRDSAEEFDRTPTREEAAQRDLQALINRLARFNVDVAYRRFSKKTRGEGFCCGYEYDESKSRWLIEVDGNAPTRLKVVLIENLWIEHVSTDTPNGNVDWDHAEGVIHTAGSLAWNATTDDLMADIEHFIGVERRRMVQQINDETSPAPDRQELDR